MTNEDKSEFWSLFNHLWMRDRGRDDYSALDWSRLETMAFELMKELAEVTERNSRKA